MSMVKAPTSYYAFPTPASSVTSTGRGMTLRAYIATEAMAAMIAGRKKDGYSRVQENVAKDAVEYADALIEELLK